MLTPLPILASLAAKPSLWESIEFILEGFVFVLVVLAILGILTTAIGALFKRFEPKPVPAPVKQVTPAMPEVSEADKNLPAVIAAAVYTVMGDKPHRILQIRPADDTWAREGRRSILGSHKVR